MAVWVPDDRDGLDRLVADLVALFSAAEQRLTRAVAVQLHAGFEDGLAADKAIRLGELRRDAEAIATALRGVYPDQVERVMAIAAESGAAAALQEMAQLAGVIDTTTTAAVSGQLAAQLATADLTSTFDDVTRRILRFPDDVYRRAVGQAATDVLLGLGTNRTAQGRAWQRLIAGGVTGFVDKANRRWNLATYVEMATRSATRRAWDDQHVATMAEHDITLVSVVVGSGSCKACAEWAGKILRTDNGPTGRIVIRSVVADRDVTVTVAGTLDDAKRHGWRHPNCRCRVVAYLPGLSVISQVTTYDPEAEADREKLRDLERRVRKAKVEESASVTPETKSGARRHRLDLQRQIAAHVKDTGLNRRRQREQINLGQRFAPNDGPNAAPRGLLSSQRVTGSGPIARSGIGEIVVPKVKGFAPEPHELDTARRLAGMGHRVVFLAPSTEKGVRTPDILLDGERAEMKAPIGAGKNTISHQIGRASGQADRLVLDTNRTSLPDKAIIDEVRRRLRPDARLREVFILTKDGKSVRISRREE